ncbi:hypothetical protein EST38_g12149 [Candolleomyces aberdarensis]|uniref:Uncharacterized protein n=1 Tax=Candolleomyces aberdarensis TaxID=2316362 RepID=A0A4Q2D6A6_9AGAR|nr:hypothetical protein EST38_g12149 [Candolleomyces aberdarensis]
MSGSSSRPPPMQPGVPLSGQNTGQGSSSSRPPPMQPGVPLSGQNTGEGSSSTRAPPMQPVPVSAQSSNPEQEWPTFFLSAESFLSNGGPIGQGGGSATNASMQNARSCMEAVESWFQLCARDHREILEHHHVMALHRMINHYRLTRFEMNEMSDGSPGMGPGLYAAPLDPFGSSNPPPRKTRVDRLKKALNKPDARKDARKAAQAAQTPTPLIFPTRSGTFLPILQDGAVSEAPPPDTCDPRPCTLGRDPVYLNDLEGRGSWFHNVWLYTKCSLVADHQDFQCQTIPAEANSLLIGMFPLPRPSPQPSPPSQDFPSQAFPPTFDQTDDGDSPGNPDSDDSDDIPSHEYYANEDTTGKGKGRMFYY